MGSDKIFDGVLPQRVAALVSLPSLFNQPGYNLVNVGLLYRRYRNNKPRIISNIFKV